MLRPRLILHYHAYKIQSDTESIRDTRSMEIDYSSQGTPPMQPSTEPAPDIRLSFCSPKPHPSRPFVLSRERRLAFAPLLLMGAPKSSVIVGSAYPPPHGTVRVWRPEAILRYSKVSPFFSPPQVVSRLQGIFCGQNNGIELLR